MSTLNIASIPMSLQCKRQWLCYRLELRDGKQTKVPRQPNGQPASTTNPETWTSIETAYRAYLNAENKFDGIGFVFNGDFVGIDLDHVVDESGNFTDYAKSVIAEMNSYTERSQSGTGLHIIVEGKLPDYIPSSGKRNEKLEIYANARYFCVTGDRVEGTPASAEIRQNEINRLVYREFPPGLITKPVSIPLPNQLGEVLRTLTPDVLELLTKAFQSKNGDRIRRLYNGDNSDFNGDESAGDMAFCSYMTYWLGRDFNLILSVVRHSGRMRGKWGRTDYQQMTIGKAIANCTSSYCVNNSYVYREADKKELDTKHDKNLTENLTNTIKPDNTTAEKPLSQQIREWIKDTNGRWFENRDIDTDLNLTSPKDKNNRLIILNRLYDDKVIENHPTRIKTWRFICRQLNELNYKNLPMARQSSIVLPLGLNTKAKLYPGNLFVIAGTTGSGKTALALDVAWRNNDNKELPVYYWYSEGGEDEIRDRLDNCPGGMDIQEWNMRAFSRTCDFQDVVVPDAINVIDYLALADNFWSIRTALNQIGGKIGTGIAVVCIQKKEGKDYGDGDRFSAELSRLYIAVEPVKGRRDEYQAKIVKCKSWATKGLNPHGMTCQYHISNGWIDLIDKDWSWEE